MPQDNYFDQFEDVSDDDFFGQFQGEQSQSPQPSRSMWDHFSLAPEFITNKARDFATSITDPNFGNSAWNPLRNNPIDPYARGFIGGALEGFSDLLSPMNVASAALGGAEVSAANKGLAGLAKLFGYGNKAIAAPMVAEGAHELAYGDNKLTGGAELAGGILGLAAPIARPKVKAPRMDILPPEVPQQRYLPKPKDPIDIGPLTETYEGPRQLGTNKVTAPSHLLPARGETSINRPGEFLAGENGLVDTSLNYPFDWNEPFRSKGGAALTPEDIAEIARVRPDLSPEQIMEMINKRGTPDFANELGSRNPMDIATGELGGNIAIGNPLDRAQIDPVFGALIPDRLKSDTEMFGPQGPMGMRGNDLPPSSLEHPQGGKIVNPPDSFEMQNYDPNLVDPVNQSLSPQGLGARVIPPKQFPQMFDSKAKLEPTRTNPDLMAKIKETARDTGDSEPVLNEAVNSTNPAVKEAAYNYVKERGMNNPFAFAGTRLKAMGSAGTELYRRASRFVQLERFNLKDWAEPYKNAVTKLSKQEQATFGSYVEGKLPIPNENVRRAVETWQRAEQAAGKSAENVGMILEDSQGNKVPFKRIGKNYWPRKLSKEEIAALPTKVDQMVAEGIKRSDALKIVANARKHGELVLPAQHKRLEKRFNYRNDALSGLEHLENMSRASARVQEFGRKDVAGHEDGILGLIEQTPNPAKAHEIMTRIIGRDENINKSLDNFVRSARTAVSWMRLQNYGISAIIGNQLPNMLRANMGEYIKSLGGFIGKNRAITDHSAAAMDISHGVFEQTAKLNPMKLYGGNLAENIVRGQAAGIGQGMAKSYFRELKKNPFNLDAKKQLFELVLEDADILLGQDKLTEPQLRMAAARSAELSQGITSPVNLPMYASKPVSDIGNAVLQLGLIFKKQAAIQTKMLYDSFKRNPVKTMALVGGMSQLAGGVIGGIKSAAIAGTRSAASGRPFEETFEHEFGNRANWVGRYTGTDNEIINGTIDRAIQSWALGSALDMAMIALDPNQLIEFTAGPVVGAGADLIGNVTNPTQLGREAMRMLPIPGGVGTGLQRELLPTRGQEIE